MKSINFDAGYKEYMINGDEGRIIKVQISDFNIYKRVKESMNEIDKIIKKYKDSGIENAVELDNEMRAVINKAFGSDICTPAFGSANLATLTENGEPIFVNFFNAFLPVLKEDIEKTAKNNTKTTAAPVIRDNVNKYLETPVVKPVAGLARPFGANIVDINSLTDEQKNFLLAQLIK